MIAPESERLISLEEQFWVGDATFYRENLTPDFRMAFPGLGLMDRQRTIEGITDGVRWDHVEILDPQVVTLGSDAAVLVYRARAKRGEEAYTALVSSAYVSAGGRWKLASHHQTPLLDER